MCLAIPGKIISVSGDSGDDASQMSRLGRVDFGGVVKEVSLAYVPEATVGSYVVVHVGFAISTMDEDEAKQVFEYLRQIEDLSELEGAAPQ
jgi:hydrogenase expression/formation protein HypC